MTKEELVGLVQKLIEADYETEEEGNEMLFKLEANVPHPRVSNLIFWDKRELTAEQIVEEALAYKPIRLPDSFE